MADDLIGLVLGAIIGFILAMTGSGGGIMAVPLLVFGLHLTMKEAAPVGLIAVGLSAFVGAALGLKEKIVRYRAALLIGVSGMVMAPIGVWFAQRIPNGPLTIGFSCLLAYTGWRVFRQSLKPERIAATQGSTPEPQDEAMDFPCTVQAGSGRLNWTRPCAQALAATGVVSGLLSGMLGAGGGFVIVPAMTHFTNVPARSIFATSLAVISLVAISGVTSAAVGGVIKWSVAVPFGAGAVVALLLGRLLTKRMRSAHLMRGFSVVSIFVAVMLFAKGLGWMH
jgi:uncharacterized protein